MSFVAAISWSEVSTALLLFAVLWLLASRRRG
jgi:hypothetical protein